MSRLRIGQRCRIVRIPANSPHHVHNDKRVHITAPEHWHDAVHVAFCALHKIEGNYGIAGIEVDVPMACIPGEFLEPDDDPAASWERLKTQLNFDPEKVTT